MDTALLHTSPALSAPPEPVSFAEAFRFWLKLGFISFADPAGQIAILHVELVELVERRRRIGEESFLHIRPPASTEATR